MAGGRGRSEQVNFDSPAIRVRAGSSEAYFIDWRGELLSWPLNFVSPGKSEEDVQPGNADDGPLINF